MYSFRCVKTRGGGPGRGRTSFFSRKTSTLSSTSFKREDSQLILMTTLGRRRQKPPDRISLATHQNNANVDLR